MTRTRRKFEELTWPLVLVSILTYNHEKYIAKAIDSALMQVTSFPFQIVIGEDCSTDKTRDICLSYKERYPDRIHLILAPENLGVKANFARVFEAWRQSDARYVALLEGDDFWTDPHKLQKQVSFLEANPEYGLVHTDCNRLYDPHGIVTRSPLCDNTIPQGNVYEDLLFDNFIMTATVMARSQCLIDAYNAIDFVRNSWIMGDYPAWLEISRHRAIGYLNEVTAVYRVLRQSASHSPDPIQRFRFSQSTFDIQCHFMNKYGCGKKTEEMIRVKHHSLMLKYGFCMGDYALAVAGAAFLKTKQAGMIEKERFLIPLCSNGCLFFVGRIGYTLRRYIRSLYDKTYNYS